MELYLYNPSTDIALARDSVNFTPSAAVRAFERQMALLPALYMPPGAAVLLPDEIPAEELPSLRHWRPGLAALNFSELRGKRVRVNPWGWNRALTARLRRSGAEVENLPSDPELASWRQLAHRRQTVKLSRLLGADEADRPVEVSRLTEAEAVLSRMDGGCMLKLPWSSSGRGVVPLFPAEDRERAMRRIGDGIRTQGSVMIEPLHTRRLDFATEWISTGREISFLGWSVFSTGESGNYGGNLTESQEALLRAISEASGQSAGQLRQLADRIRRALEQILLTAPCPYRGPLGVDGLVTESGRIIPYVEINLRMTMGHVALAQARAMQAMQGQQVPQGQASRRE